MSDGYTLLNFLPCQQNITAVNLPDGSTISAYVLPMDKGQLGEIKPLEEGYIAWLTGESALRAYFVGNNNIDLNK